MTENKKSTRKIYNPKSHAPAVYLPAWLSQVPSTELSLQAKIVYGRLAQWSNSKSIVHRSTKQLGEELGIHQRVVKRFLAELREVGLIETYQSKKGGENYYRFLDHDWIHAQLLNVFDYVGSDENVTTPVTKTSLPRDESVTPKVKEIKVNKKRVRLSQKSFCPGTIELVTSEEAETIAKQKGIDLDKSFYAFSAYAKSKGWTRDNWQAAFVKWLIDERVRKTDTRNTETRCTVPEFKSNAIAVNSTDEVKGSRENAKKAIREITDKLKTGKLQEPLRQARL